MTLDLNIAKWKGTRLASKPAPSPMNPFRPSRLKGFLLHPLHDKLKVNFFVLISSHDTGQSTLNKNPINNVDYLPIRVNTFSSQIASIRQDSAQTTKWHPSLAAISFEMSIVKMVAIFTFSSFLLEKSDSAGLGLLRPQPQNPNEKQTLPHHL